jgi:DNA-binding PadR family transcriptional regulator
MYPMLHELEKAGYLRRIDRVVNGKVRKYYAITRRGVGALADARRKIAELVGEVLAPGVTTGAAKVVLSRIAAKTRRAPERGRAEHKSLRGVE